jgi:hypothetical protein
MEIVGLALLWGLILLRAVNPLRLLCLEIRGWDEVPWLRWSPWLQSFTKLTLLSRLHEVSAYGVSCYAHCCWLD